MAKTFDLLNSRTITSNTSTFSFTSIPQTYTELYLTFSMALGGAYFSIVIGNTVYHVAQIGFGAGTVTPGTYTSGSELMPLFNNAPNNSITNPTTGIIQMFNYTAGVSGRTQTHLSVIGGYNLRIMNTASRTSSNGSVSSISFASNGNNFFNGSFFRLYGIARA